MLRQSFFRGDLEKGLAQMHVPKVEPCDLAVIAVQFEWQ